MTLSPSDFKIAIVGAGPWAQSYYETITDLGAKVVAYTREKDVPVGRQNKFYDTPFFTRETFYQRCLDGMDVDGVVVAAHPSMHADVAAMLPSLPLLIEKPLALSSQTIMDLLLQRDGISTSPAMVGYIHLWSHAFQEILKRCPPDEIVRIDTIGGSNGPNRNWSSLYDYGSHDISMLLALLQHRAESLQLTNIEIEKTSCCGNIWRTQGQADGVLFSVIVGNGLPGKCRHIIVTLRDGTEWTYDDTLPSFMKVMGKHPMPLFSKTNARNQAVYFSDLEKEPSLNSMVKGFFALINDSCDDDLHPESMDQGLRFSLKVTKILEQIEKKAKKKAA